MYAFGDSYLFIAVFGLLALVPTGAALYFLRPYRPVWTALSALGLCVAITGVAAAVLFAVGRHEVVPSTLTAWADFSVLRILLAPILAPVFLVVALFTPFRFPRFALLVAAVMELAVVAFAGLVWFVPLFFQNS
jgi:Na+-translocating ferredoxin:NAD+ oxidoreductase RnfA subunit